MTDENAGQDRPAVEGNELERSWWGAPPTPAQSVEPDAQPPVNDAPTFTPGASQTAISLLGAETVNGWATGISPGPSDESAQTVTFQVSVSNPSLFAVQPKVGSDGKLTYTPKALALGSATVTVTPVDDGGTDNGGQATGTPRTFTITIV